ncbi:hypothetical protein SAMN05216337_1001213 [Bradyrhizobium brasilense]|uniref:Uncharacterized protein n=1 Tax=Bradyrhizobium brasilense TaxID=1419277 RepID=A0A1G6IPG0_9BRAD|nr:hypothetical protein [Bradyrhizobium brasilense]SDC08374.1 hypothetical protein SAMN05216337_1001213 [Bradyrhizobium brasilense]
MNERIKMTDETPLLTKADPNSPALKVEGLGAVLIKAGTAFAGMSFDADTAVRIDGLEPGTDYLVQIESGAPVAVKHADGGGAPCLGGFHFAPGGNAEARGGGDSVPAINPFSLWDRDYRPACADPRGMALVEMPGRKFWCDIYLTGVDCSRNGTSAFGVTIADGDDCPRDSDGERYRRFDYSTAAAVMAVHGKGLLSVEEFFAAAFGVTEKTALDRDPKTTGLDAPRTSRFGIMQATGNMWIWGHDGDPDMPRASMFGGSWLSGGHAGSRYAVVAYYWPGSSNDSLGARGRSDHLQLG